MVKRLFTLSLIGAIVALSALSNPAVAQDIEQEKARYESLAKQINEIRNKMMSLEAGQQDEYNKLEAQFKELTAESAKLRKIMEGDLETKKEISDVKKLYNEGLNAYKIQRYNDALQKYNEAISRGKELNNPLANEAIVKSYFGIGNVFFRQKKYSDMIEPLQKAVEIDPNNFGVYYLMGRSYDNQGLYDKAIASYKKSLELNNSPGNYIAHFNMGVTYFNLKQYNNARDEFLHSIDSKPNHAKSYLYLGRAYFEMKQYGNAENALQHSIQLDEKAYQAYFFLARVYNKTGQYRSAITAANNAMKYHRRKNKFGGALIERGRANVNLGNSAQALEDFNAARNDRQYRKTAEYEIEILTKFGGKKGEDGKN